MTGKSRQFLAELQLGQGKVTEIEIPYNRNNN